MANCTRLAVTKVMPYRGLPEEFANDYCWKDAAPDGSDNTFWMNLMNEVHAHEAPLFDSQVKFVEAYGWNDFDVHATHVFHYVWDAANPPQGTFSPTTGARVGAGDQASFVNFPGSQRSSRGKQTYFRKYFHRPYLVDGAADDLDPAYHAALQNYAQASPFIWNLRGPLTNQLAAKKYGPGENMAISTGGGPTYVTTRTLKRRGKRPRPRQ